VKLNPDEQSPTCSICIYSSELAGLKEMACKKRGVVAPDYYCKKFELNILAKSCKRKHSLDKTKIEKMDFSI
jgi:hypothetical protein